jgi:hypothetical protein
LRARQDVFPVENTLADWDYERMTSNAQPLTEEQKAQNKDIFDKFEQRDQEAKNTITELEENLNKLRAENEFLKAKGEAKKSATKKDRTKERSEIKQSIKDKWKKAANDGTLTAVPIPYAKQLYAIAPDVAKLMQSYIADGIDKLDDIVSRIHADLKEDFPEVTEKDTVDMIAGLYRKETKPELEKKLNQIADKKSEEAVRLQARIKAGDFSDKSRPKSVFEDPEAQKKFPVLYKKALNALAAKENARHEFDLAKLRDAEEKKGFPGKARQFVREFKNTATAVKAGIDFSAIGIQNLLFILSHPIEGGKAVGKAFHHLVSEAEFERQLAKHHNSAYWPLLVKMGVDVVEPKSLIEAKKEEVFKGRTLLDREIKIGGKKIIPSKFTTSPFERHFTTMGNELRINLALRRAQTLMDKGMTIETHEKEFTDAAKVINTISGRGPLPEVLQKANPFISTFIWAPKLIVSNVNLLGLGEVRALWGLKNGFYTSLTPMQRNYAIREVVQGIGTGVALMVAAAYMGAKVDDDPKSVTFGNVKIGDNSYNIFGRFTPYVRYLWMMKTGQRRTASGIENIDDANGTSRAKETWKLFRGKFNPLAGVASDAWFDERYDGSKFTLKGAAQDLFVPMSIDDINKGINNDGLLKGVMLRGIPSALGVKVSNEKDFTRKMTVPDHFTSDGKKVDLSEAQQAEYEKAATEKLNEWTVNLKASSEYNAASKEDKAKLENVVFDAAKEFAEKQIKKTYKADFKISHDEERQIELKKRNLEKLKKSIGIKK